MRLGKRKNQRVLRMVGQAIVALGFLFPFYWAMVLSVAPKSRVFTLPPDLVPGWDFHPWERVFQAAPWGLYFLHSVIITGSTILLVLVTGATAGYALSLPTFRGREMVFGIFLAALMVPPEAILIPDYVVAYHLHILNTLRGQVLPFAVNVFAIFIFRQFFKTLPSELWDAAQLDGASWWRYLWHMALPLSKPAVATVSLLTFSSQWSQFQWPLIITQGQAARPIEVALSYFQGFDGTHWRELAAASILTLIPIIVMFLFTQRYFVVSVAGRVEDRESSSPMTPLNR